MKVRSASSFLCIRAWGSCNASDVLIAYLSQLLEPGGPSPARASLQRRAKCSAGCFPVLEQAITSVP